MATARDVDGDLQGICLVNSLKYSETCDGKSPPRRGVGLRRIDDGEVGRVRLSVYDGEVGIHGAMR